MVLEIEAGTIRERRILAPLVHLNGTSREALSGAYEAAGRAVMAALESLQEAAPNARDYYPLGEDAYRRAEAEHVARVAALRAVYEDTLALYEHVENVVRQ